MHFDILTLFPEAIEPYLNSSILKRGCERGLFSWCARQIREHAVDEYGHVDDTLYGGGKGMLMLADPIRDSYADAVRARADIPPAKRRFIYLSPKGRTFDQALARELLQYEQLILLCGHYEGVDARVIEELGAEEISLGDFVLSGGELAALAVVDAVCRMIPGVLPDASAFENESHYDGRLEARQYTRPPRWEGREVPAVLLEGHHAKIAKFRRLDGLNETLLKRPELFDRLALSEAEIRELIAYRAEAANGNNKNK